MYYFLIMGQTRDGLAETIEIVMDWWLWSVLYYLIYFQTVIVCSGLSEPRMDRDSLTGNYCNNLLCHISHINVRTDTVLSPHINVKDVTKWVITIIPSEAVSSILAPVVLSILWQSGMLYVCVAVSPTRSVFPQKKYGKSLFFAPKVCIFIKWLHIIPFWNP